MNTIVGNNHLINIALKAESPSKAAKIATAFGYSKIQIKAVRDAAKIRRDKGIDEFDSLFKPYEDVAIGEAQLQFTKLTATLFIDTPYEHRPLNVKEYEDVAKIIQKELAKINVTARVKIKQINSPFTKSNLATKYDSLKPS